MCANASKALLVSIFLATSGLPIGDRYSVPCSRRHKRLLPTPCWFPTFRWSLVLCWSPTLSAWCSDVFCTGDGGASSGCQCCSQRSSFRPHHAFSLDWFNLLILELLDSVLIRQSVDMERKGLGGSTDLDLRRTGASASVWTMSWFFFSRRPERSPPALGHGGSDTSLIRSCDSHCRTP